MANRQFKCRSSISEIQSLPWNITQPMREEAFQFFSGSAGGHALLATLLALRLHFLGTSSNVASIGACKRNKVGVTAMSDFQQ